MSPGPNTPQPYPEPEPRAAGGGGLEPDMGVRLRRNVLLAATTAATVLSGTFWLIGASKDVSSSERVIVPVLTLLFAAVGLMTWRGHLRHAELLLLSVGGGVLLERIHFTTQLPGPGTVPLSNAYELFIWFPCVYVFAFLLLERREAILFNLALLGAGMFVVRDWLLPGGPGPYYGDLSEFFIGLLGCATTLYAFAYMRERLIDTHRMAVDLRAFAETDFLTGIANRRAISNHLEREIKRSEREGTPLAVLLFDLDRFKRINDAHGHDEGDRALRRVSLIVDRARRDTDFFGRWGGEEFMVVAPGVDVEHGRVAAERYRALIDASTEKGRTHVTASFGVSEYRFGDDVASLVKRADEALMRAKESGRNRVCGSDRAA